MPCPTGKRTYDKRQIKRVQSTATGSKLRAYRCPDCGQLHLTSQSATVDLAWRRHLGAARWPA